MGGKDDECIGRTRGLISRMHVFTHHALRVKLKEWWSTDLVKLQRLFSTDMCKTRKVSSSDFAGFQMRDNKVERETSVCY